MFVTSAGAAGWAGVAAGAASTFGATYPGNPGPTGGISSNFGSSFLGATYPGSPGPIGGTGASADTVLVNTASGALSPTILFALINSFSFCLNETSSSSENPTWYTSMIWSWLNNAVSYLILLALLPWSLIRRCIFFVIYYY